jgi:Ni,Fe-hydrogenase III large subunit
LRDAGDALARTQIRSDEIQTSISIISELLLRNLIAKHEKRLRRLLEVIESIACSGLLFFLAHFKENAAVNAS